MINEIRAKLISISNQVLNEYGLVIVCILVGIIFGWYGKMFLADRKYQQQIELRIKEKDERISHLSELTLEKISKVKVVKQDAGIIQKLKKYFKRSIIIKQQ